MSLKSWKRSPTGSNPMQESRERSSLAPYATVFSEGARRIHKEDPDPIRDPFDLDRHRILESTAFRRLEGKTQVMAPTAGDHFRTRLTHTLEVSHIARCLARCLRVHENLSESIALAHDLGHPPFGHAGESALRQCMSDHGGFNHNTHSLRVVEYLEHPFPAFRGLNLTEATRLGLRDHETQYDTPGSAGTDGRPSVEAQLASIADRIAYDCHDLEDAIGARFVSLDSLASVELWTQALDRSGMSTGESIFAVRRAVIDAMMNTIMLDAIQTSQPTLDRLGGPADVREATIPLIGFSESLDEKLRDFEAVLASQVYRRPEVAEADRAGRNKVTFLFDWYTKNPQAMPDRFVARVDDQGAARVACDYIAGMTDRYCVQAYERYRGH
ncbi:MAG: dGTP triphosphohydrolase [Planctomycetota bacterium]